MPAQEEQKQEKERLLAEAKRDAAARLRKGLCKHLS